VKTTVNEAQTSQCLCLFSIHVTNTSGNGVTIVCRLESGAMVHHDLTDLYEPGNTLECCITVML